MRVLNGADKASPTRQYLHVVAGILAGYDHGEPLTFIAQVLTLAGAEVIAPTGNAEFLPLLLLFFSSIDSHGHSPLNLRG